MILEVVPARPPNTETGITPSIRHHATMPGPCAPTCLDRYVLPRAPALVPRDNGYSVRLKSHMPITSVGIPIRHGFTPDLRRVTLSDCRRPARKEPPRCAGIDFLGLIVVRPDWMIGVLPVRLQAGEELRRPAGAPGWL